MKRILHGILNDYIIIKSNEIFFDEKSINFSDKFSAIDFLREFMHDFFNINTMRYMVSDKADISRFNDQEVIDLLATQLIREQVKIIEFQYVTSERGYQSSTTSEPTVKKQDEPEKTETKPLRPTETKEHTNPTQIKQAAILKKAAAAGTPLCET